jgi:DNA-binding transcriptional regulator YdaS (Cro superfamily)
MPAPNLKRKIDSLLALNGVTRISIARNLGIRREYIYQIVTGERTGYRIRPAIASACGVTVSDLWPDTPQQYLEAA